MKFLNMIKDGENFAFARFSDGELFILQNKSLVLAENHWSLDGNKMGGTYIKEEQNFNRIIKCIQELLKRSIIHPFNKNHFDNTEIY